jgi:Asp/Glu/hydantoin racemase
MNRAFREVKETMEPLGVPVVQIDEAMMEQAVNTEGRILVVATHGPTVKSTQSLLQETADRLGRKVNFVGATIEEAFNLLGEGKIAEHNQAIAETIREVQSREQVDVVVLAQLSMSVFSFSYPDSEQEFGIPVLNSGQTGFARAGEILRQQ